MKYKILQNYKLTLVENFNAYTNFVAHNGALINNSHQASIENKLVKLKSKFAKLETELNQMDHLLLTHYQGPPQEPMVSSSVEAVNTSPEIVIEQIQEPVAIPQKDSH